MCIVCRRVLTEFKLHCCMCAVMAKIKVDFVVFSQGTQKKHRMTGMPNLDLLGNLGDVLSFGPTT